MKDRILQQLKTMFVGKKVKITYKHGKYQTVTEESVGNCTAIHATPSGPSLYDIELDHDERHGITVLDITDNICHALAGGGNGGTRDIEVI